MKLSKLLSLGLVASIACILPACADSSFTGAATQKKADRAADAKGKGGVDGDGDDSLDATGGKRTGVLNNDGTDVLGDGGSAAATPVPIETTEGCGGGSKVADPEATYSFASAGEMTTLVNSQGKYTMIPIEKWNAGAVHFDQASADAVCRIKGYLASSAKTAGKYSSCSDNNLGSWDDVQKNFIVNNACKDNTRLDRLTCKGKMRDICATDLSWVFKKP